MPSFGDPRPELLIVGLAPGLRGANRTGRPFTGDYAGDLLYRSLLKFGFASGSYGANAGGRARIAPCPHHQRGALRAAAKQAGNRPRSPPAAAFSRPSWRASPSLRAILALGAIAHNAVLAAKGLKRARYTFAHGALHELPDGTLLADSYHCSRLNTNTGKLTPKCSRR